MSDTNERGVLEELLGLAQLDEHGSYVVWVGNIEARLNALEV